MTLLAYSQGLRVVPCPVHRWEIRLPEHVAGQVLQLCSLLTNSSCRDWVRLILVGLQGAEDVCCSVEGA